MALLRALPKAIHHQGKSPQATWHAGILPGMAAFQPLTLDPERSVRDVTRASQEILPELAAVDGASVDVMLEIHASALEGFPAEKVMAVHENARTLRFSQQYCFDDQ
jgi:hypothetical protein